MFITGSKAIPPGYMLPTDPSPLVTNFICTSLSLLALRIFPAKCESITSSGD